MTINSPLNLQSPSGGKTGWIRNRLLKSYKNAYETRRDYSREIESKTALLYVMNNVNELAFTTYRIYIPVRKLCKLCSFSQSTSKDEPWNAFYKIYLYSIDVLKEFTCVLDTCWLVFQFIPVIYL